MIFFFAKPTWPGLCKVSDKRQITIFLLHSLTISSRSNHVTSMGFGGSILININNAKTQTQHNTTAMNQPNEPTKDTFPCPRLYTFKIYPSVKNMFALWLVLATLPSTKHLKSSTHSSCHLEANTNKDQKHKGPVLSAIFLNELSQLPRYWNSPPAWDKATSNANSYGFQTEVRRQKNSFFF